MSAIDIVISAFGSAVLLKSIVMTSIQTNRNKQVLLHDVMYTHWFNRPTVDDANCNV